MHEPERMPEEWRRALAVVAHPDDLEYGTAGAVAEWTDSGREVAYLLVTRGEAGIDGMHPTEAAPVRETEQRASAAIVGVSSVEFLDHRDGVIEGNVALRREIASAIRRHQPEMVVTINHHDTWGAGMWNTPDHREVGRAVLDAACDAGNRWIFPDVGPGPWDGVRWVAVAGSPHPTHVQPVTENRVQRAIDSLAEHRAYLTGLTAGEPADTARSVLTEIMGEPMEHYGGQRVVPFELFPR